jgi:hypothetical protein
MSECSLPAFGFSFRNVRHNYPRVTGQQRDSLFVLPHKEDWNGAGQFFTARGAVSAIPQRSGAALLTLLGQNVSDEVVDIGLA